MQYGYGWDGSNTGNQQALASPEQEHVEVEQLSKSMSNSAIEDEPFDVQQHSKSESPVEGMELAQSVPEGMPNQNLMQKPDDYVPKSQNVNGVKSSI